MKKRLLVCCLALLIAVCGVSTGLAERKVPPAGQVEGAVAPYFIVSEAFFKEDTDYIVLGQETYDAYKKYDQPGVITKAGDDYLLPIDSLSKIFQIAYTYDEATGILVLEDGFDRAELTVDSLAYTINGYDYTLANAPALIDGVLCIPAIEVCTKAFGLIAGESLGYGYLAYEKTELPSGATGLSGAITRLTYPDKAVGVFEPVYWFEEAGMLMPYRVVIPATYDPQQPSKLVVYLHGSGGNDNRDMDRTANYNGSTGTWWDFLCGEFNFIGLSVNGYTPETYGANADNEDAAKAQASALAELEVLHAIEQVKASYNIDDAHIFLMGNSMGSGGTTWLACKYPGMFAAISPSGLFPANAGSEGLHDMGTREYSKLGDLPIRVVMGTEDRFYPTALATYQELAALGMNITFTGVVGGYHNTAWSQGDTLRDTFMFFDGVK